MAIPKKGSRKIICREQAYRWLASRDRLVSDWQLDPGKVDPEWLAFAQRYRLGSVAETRITVAIEANENPKGRLILHVYGTSIDGFLGMEHNIQIKPAMIKSVIEQALDAGWNASKNSEFRLALHQEQVEPFRPVLLVFGDAASSIAHYPKTIVLP